MPQRFRTRDGKKVTVGDQVWSQNHWPWMINGVERRYGVDWVLMTHDEVGQDTLDMAVMDFTTYIYKSHPPQGCLEAGCRHRPWGALR
ncbi:hypothetical protein ACFXKD_09860 [Nocardiopsis aegyptia]|uniref:hypothetical protein n=1 Tax=Nocardiopsis aegyptia TaxID=220378 RepID=UPI0036723969